MNYLWGFMILVSLIYSFVNGNIGETMQAAFDGATNAVTLVLSFAGVMCLWTGLINAMEEAGLSRVIKKLLSPVMKLLFPRLDRKSRAFDFITLNICANLLGLGNGATPMGVKAMKELDGGGDYPTDEMCMFIVLNTTAFQLIPSSILALRSAMGAEEPFSVIVPIWITSLTALTVSVICVKIMCGFKRKRRRK